MDKARVQAYLQAACSVLNFDIGEIWCCRCNIPDVPPSGAKSNRDLRFIQLYTSPHYERHRNKLVIPTDIPDENDVDKHNFSPLICEAVREARQVVWAHTRHPEGLLGRSDLALRTAVGVPVCSIGFDLCILLMFSPDVVELTDDAHRFLYTVAQAATDAVCGFLPASSSSPVHSTLSLPRPPLPDNGEATGPHTRSLINALPPTVTIQMVDMAAISSLSTNPEGSEGPLPIKPEFMEAFHSIYPNNNNNTPHTPTSAASSSMAADGGPPPLIASHSSSGGMPPLIGMPPLMPSLSGDADQFDSLPPLEDCILPDLLGVEEGTMGRGGEEEDWDFEAALDYIFDSSRTGVVSGSEWFKSQQRAAYDDDWELGEEGQELLDSPITYFYKDRLQRVRFEEFVKGFLSMSVFHTAECWVARGQDTIEPVFCATCLGDVEKWKDKSAKLYNDPVRALPARVSRENRSIWEQDFDRANGVSCAPRSSSSGSSSSSASGHDKAYSVHSAFGLPVPIDRKHRLIVIFYSTFALQPALLMETFIKRAMDLLWVRASPPPLTFLPDLPPPSEVPHTTPPHLISTDYSDPSSPSPYPSSSSYPSAYPEVPPPTPTPTPTSSKPLLSATIPIHFDQARPLGPSPSPSPLMQQHQQHPPQQQQQQQHYPYQQPPPQPQQPPPHYPPQPPYPPSLYTQPQPYSDYSPHPSSPYPNPHHSPHPHSHSHTGGHSGGGSSLHSAQGHSYEEGASNSHSHSHSHSHSNQGQGPPQSSQVGGSSHLYPPQPPHSQPHPMAASMMSYHPLPPQSHLPSPYPPMPQPHPYPYQQQPPQPLPSSLPYPQPPLTGGGSLTSRLTGGPPALLPPPLHPSSSYPGTPTAARSMMPLPTPNDPLIQGGVPVPHHPSAIMGGGGGQYVQHMPNTHTPSQQQGLMMQGQGQGQGPIKEDYGASLPQEYEIDIKDGSNGGGRKVCKTDMCGQPTAKRSPYCTAHTGARHCQFPGCTKCAQGNTKYCIAHGGGRRCTYPGCTKGARDKNFCAAHGGGKRCTMDGCTKSAVGGSNLCTAHGGGRRCHFQDCTRSAQSSTNYCVRHGGGRKCQVEGCQKVARGRTSYCAGHGGGVRCKVDGCNKAAVGKFQMCRMHSGYPKKRASESISSTHFLGDHDHDAMDSDSGNPASKRMAIGGLMMGPQGQGEGEGLGLMMTGRAAGEGGLTLPLSNGHHLMGPMMGGPIGTMASSGPATPTAASNGLM